MAALAIARQNVRRSVNSRLQDPTCLTSAPHRWSMALAARDLAGNTAVPIDLAVPGFGIPDRLGSIIG